MSSAKKSKTCRSSPETKRCGRGDSHTGSILHCYEAQTDGKSKGCRSTTQYKKDNRNNRLKSPGKKKASSGKKKASSGKEKASPGKKKASPGKKKASPGKKKASRKDLVAWGETPRKEEGKAHWAYRNL